MTNEINKIHTQKIIFTKEIYRTFTIKLKNTDLNLETRESVL